MDIKSLYRLNDFDGIITELEAALQIDGKDYEESEFTHIIQNVRTRINRQYQIDLSLGKINDISFESGIYHAAVALFIDNVASIHSRLCALCQIERYTTTSLVNLGVVNYLSYKKESLMKVLQLLQREKTLLGTSASESVSMIENRLAMIRICREKRLFMILIVAYELGFNEIVASVAEILYFGGRI